MRSLLVVAVVAACGKAESIPSAGSAVQVGSATSQVAATPSLAMQSVTLLEPEDVVGQRLADVEPFGNVLKGVAAAVAAFDAAHPRALPAELNAVVAARASGTRVWLVGPAGDVAAPGLDAELAKLPRVAVKERQVAAVVHLLRDGATPDPKLRQIPVAWASAIGSAGGDVDDVIDKVWPR